MGPDPIWGRPTIQERTCLFFALAERRFVFVRRLKERERVCCLLPECVFGGERPHNEQAGKKSGGSKQLSDTTQTWALLNNYGRVCVCVWSMPRNKRHIACDGWMLGGPQKIHGPAKQITSRSNLYFIYSQVNGPRVIWPVWFCSENHTENVIWVESAHTIVYDLCPGSRGIGAKYLHWSFTLNFNKFLAIFVYWNREVFCIAQ